MFKPEITIWFNIKDLNRTRNFYEGTLGLRMMTMSEEMRLCILESPLKDCCLGFSEAQQVLPSTASVVFEVEHIESAIAELTAKGVSFSGGVDVVPGMVKLATFADPDGHSLMLSQTLLADPSVSKV